MTFQDSATGHQPLHLDCIYTSAYNKKLFVRSVLGRHTVIATRTHCKLATMTNVAWSCRGTRCKQEDTAARYILAGAASRQLVDCEFTAQNDVIIILHLLRFLNPF